MNYAISRSALSCLLAVLIFLASISTYAAIYKYVDPLTGDVQYTNYPKPGGVRMNTSDTLSEIPQSKNFRSAPPTKASFRERSLQLKSGMSAPEVARLLGMPIRTESSTYGSTTKKPWNGVSWKYASADGQLKVVFQTVDGKLYVNNWSW